MIGRKLVIQFAIVLTIILLVITTHTTNAIVAYIACFYWGVAGICRYTVIFVWASELFPPGHGSNSITALRAMIGLTLFLMNFYFMFASSSFVPIFQVTVLVSIVIFIIVFIYPESPQWLISTGREDEAIESFRRIAQLNNKEEPVIKKLDVPSN